MPLKLYDPQYLGDAVYAQHDGYQIGLSLGSHEYSPVLWLEPEVLKALVNYAKTHRLLAAE